MNRLLQVISLYFRSFSSSFVRRTPQKEKVKGSSSRQKVGRGSRSRSPVSRRSRSASPRSPSPGGRGRRGGERGGVKSPPTGAAWPARASPPQGDRRQRSLDSDKRTRKERHETAAGARGDESSRRGAPAREPEARARPTGGGAGRGKRPASEQDSSSEPSSESSDSSSSGSSSSSDSSTDSEDDVSVDNAPGKRKSGDAAATAASSRGAKKEGRQRRGGQEPARQRSREDRGRRRDSQAERARKRAAGGRQPRSPARSDGNAAARRDGRRQREAQGAEPQQQRGARDEREARGGDERKPRGEFRGEREQRDFREQGEAGRGPREERRPDRARREGRYPQRGGQGGGRDDGDPRDQRPAERAARDAYDRGRMAPPPADKSRERWSGGAADVTMLPPRLADADGCDRMLPLHAASDRRLSPLRPPSPPSQLLPDLMFHDSQFNRFEPVPPLRFEPYDDRDPYRQTMLPPPPSQKELYRGGGRGGAADHFAPMLPVLPPPMPEILLDRYGRPRLPLQKTMPPSREIGESRISVIIIIINIYFRLPSDTFHRGMYPIEAC